MPAHIAVVQIEPNSPSPAAAASAPATPITATVTWNHAGRPTKTRPAAPLLLDQELYLAAPMRGLEPFGRKQRKYHGPKPYPKMRYYRGYYYFTQTDAHVWYESLLEADTLAFLDARKDIVAITSQPMEIAFDDGSVHFPDFMAMHADHRQVVYDVKPLKFMDDDTIAQFDKTRAICKRVGWDYEVIHEMPPMVRENIAWLWSFKHYGYRPAPEVVTRLLAALQSPLTLIDAARAMQMNSIPAARSALFHLIWARDINIDLTSRLTDKTIVERTSNVASA